MRLRSQPCPCTIRCPFHCLCCLCVKNHRLDGTLPACCVPRFDLVEMLEKKELYPDCRTPLLWIIYYAENPEKLEEDLKKLKSDNLRLLVAKSAEKLGKTARKIAEEVAQ